MFSRIYSQFIRLKNRRLFNKVCCNINDIVIGPDVATNFIIKSPRKLVIGECTAINGNCYINAYGGVNIGKFCHIAKGLTIFSANHNYKSNQFIPYDDVIIDREVKIGDAVWIGANVTIAPGTSIGNGVIISTGSVVFGDVPDCAIIRGNPAKVIKYRDKEVFSSLYKAGKFK
jgi:acetyltransferase-like isoleucine patch superfamily enzyme